MLAVRSSVVHVTLADRPEFLAGDHTVLRELLHPSKQPVALGYSLAHGTLAPGVRSKWHRLTSSEVYYIIAGQGRLTIGRLGRRSESRIRCLCASWRQAVSGE